MLAGGLFRAVPELCEGQTPVLHCKVKSCLLALLGFSCYNVRSPTQPIQPAIVAALPHPILSVQASNKEERGGGGNQR